MAQCHLRGKLVRHFAPPPSSTSLAPSSGRGRWLRVGGGGIYPLNKIYNIHAYSVLPQRCANLKWREIHFYPSRLIYRRQFAMSTTVRRELLVSSAENLVYFVVYFVDPRIQAAWGTP